ncbi:MAG: bacterial Ig-like domain-containing protein, partial [Clostridia bacterium]|nr:bacterial Ig-like domain-containing protein [Clostridia bacterium]
MKVNKFSFKLKFLLFLSLIAAALCCTVLAFTINKNNAQTASAESTVTVVIYASGGTYMNNSDAEGKVRITLDVSKKIYTTTTGDEIKSRIQKLEMNPGDEWVSATDVGSVSAGSLKEGNNSIYMSTAWANIKAYFDIYVWSNVSSVAVTTQPTQKTYTAGDRFNPSGMVLTATYGSRTETVSGYTVTNGASLNAGQTSVTVSYTENGVTKTTTVTGLTVNKADPVVNPKIALTDTLYTSSAMPAITTTAGDTAGTIEWTTTSLKAGTNSCGWRFTPTDTANYNTVTGVYTLYAERVEPTSINSEYNAGANTVFTTTTLEQLKSYIRLTAINNDGSDFEVPAEDYELSGTLTEGDCFIYAMYYGLVTAVEVTNVQSATIVTLSSLTAEFTDGANKSYHAYDKFNTSGVVVTAIYSDGTTKQVADYTFSYADITKDYLVAGDTYVNFRYTDGDESVNCQLRGLTVAKAKPTVNPNISLNEKLFAGDNIPKITLSEGDTAGSISWTETLLSAGTKSYTWNFVPTDFNYDVASGSYIFTADTLALESITATYSPEEGFKVTTVTPLEEIRNRITVNGVFNNGTPYTEIANFELFGTLKAGTSVLTVTYGGV